MMREELFRAVGEARDGQVLDADAPVKKAASWKRYAALAACLALVLTGGLAFERWLHTGQDSPGEVTAPIDGGETDAGTAGQSDRGGQWYSGGDTPAAPAYSGSAVEIGQLAPESIEARTGPAESSAACLAWLDPEEIFAKDTAVFRGVVRNMRYFRADHVGAEDAARYFTVASVEVLECYRGGMAQGDVYNVLIPSVKGIVESSIDGPLADLEVGSEAIFMPYWSTPDTGAGAEDNFFCYADVSDLWFSEGIRFVFLRTEEGVDYDSGVYEIPAAGAEVTLDDVAAYVQSMLPVPGHAAVEEPALNSTGGEVATASYDPTAPVDEIPE